MTPESLKAWARDCASCAYAVLMARAFAQTERARVDAYALPIFRRYHFKPTDRRECNPAKLTEAGELMHYEDLHLVDDLNDPEVLAFYAELAEAHAANGHDGERGTCPALKAEHMVIVAERLLLELAEATTGIRADRVWGEKRRQYLEMLIGLCVAEVPRTADEVLTGRKAVS